MSPQLPPGFEEVDAMAPVEKRYLLLIAAGAAALALVVQLQGTDPTKTVGDPVPKKEYSGAMQALDLWAAQRAYPDATVPDVGHAVAFGQTGAMRAAHARDTYPNDDPYTHPIDDTVEPWASLGPNNIGGRTLALALRPGDPDVIFAGSASGGLWKSVTGGAGADAWEYVETGFPVLGVGTIAIDPGNPDVMYIGTGEVYQYQNSIGGDVNRGTRGSYGIGILKSTDGGSTWRRTLDWTYHQSRGVWSIRIHPTDSNVVYAATTEGVFKSTDTGESWTLVLDVVMATDLRIHPTTPDTVLVACGNFGSPGNGIYKTTNGGQSWYEVTAGLPPNWTGKAMIDIAPSGPHIVYASIANTLAGFGLYRSLDTGEHWSRINSTDFQQYQGWYSHYVLVSPNNVNHLFVGGIEISRSDNGGTNLEVVSDVSQLALGTPPAEGPGGGPQYAHADHHFAVWHPTDLNTVFFASDGGVFKTTDDGDTFVGLNGGYVTTQFYQGFSNSTGDSSLAIGGMQDNLTAIYEGTNEWRRVIGGDGSWTAINPLNDQTLYGSAQYLTMFRSRDGGANWVEITPPGASQLTAFIAPFVLAPTDPVRIYAGRATVYRSNNEGLSWSGTTTLDGNPVFTMAVSAIDADVVFAATAPGFVRGHVFRSMNGGDDWTDVTGTLPDRYFSDIAIDPVNDRVVYITLMGFGTSHVFRSFDYGDTWEDVGSGLPDIPVSSVELDPDHPQVVYVGTDLGVYASPYNGWSWFPFMKGMPMAMVNDLKFYGPTGKIRAATHGNGVYERDRLNLIITDARAHVVKPVDAGFRVAPNPIAADSRIMFTLDEPGAVRLSLFDVSGRRVTVLADGYRSAGEHSFPLRRGAWANGVYFVKLETRGKSEVARIVFLK